MALNLYLTPNDLKRLCSLFIAAVLLLPLTSCVGIGDGALLGGAENKPSKPHDPADTALSAIITANDEATQKEALLKPSIIAQLGEIVSCHIFLTENGFSSACLSLAGEEAAEVYRLFSEAGEKYSYEYNGYSTLDYIKLVFVDAEGDKEIFGVGPKDSYMQTVGASPISSGTIDGLYNNIKGRLK